MWIISILRHINLQFQSHPLAEGPMPEKFFFIWNKLYGLNNTINYSLNYNNPLALDPNRMRFSNFGSHTLMT